MKPSKLSSTTDSAKTSDAEAYDFLRHFGLQVPRSWDLGNVYTVV